MDTVMFVDNNNMSQPKYYNYDNMHSEQNYSAVMTDDDTACYISSSAFYEPARPSDEASPLMMSPWNQTPFYNSNLSNSQNFEENVPQFALIGSLTREEGHIYSLAASGTDILYTASDSKNIRVWKNLKEFSGFKSCSGLVKTIVLVNGKVYTGHQDGKIRVWKVSRRNPTAHKLSGTLPTLKEILRRSIKPSNYVEVRRHHTSLWIKHSDVVSCLSINEDQTLLYSASWDKTVKVWRLSDSKCLESVHAHNDAVNSVVASVDDLVYTGSADGTVKVWKREKSQGKARTATKHTLSQTLLKQDSALTALATNTTGNFIYCGSSDGLVNFWVRQIAHDQLSHSGILKGHKLAVLCLVAAGSLVFSGSTDKTICVWRRDHGSMNHTCLTVLHGHAGPVKCLAVEKDSELDSDGQTWTLYSGSLDKSVKVWSVRERAFDVDRTEGIYQIGYDGDFVPPGGSFSSSRGGSRRR